MTRPYLSMDSESLPLLELRVERAQDELVQAIRAADPAAVLAGLRPSIETMRLVGRDDEGLRRQVAVFEHLEQLADALRARDNLEGTSSD